MTIKKELVEKVFKLTQQGHSQREIKNITGVSERAQRHWKRNGYPDLNRIRTKKLSTTEVPKVTAADLVKAGFRADKVHIILSALDIALQQGNDRLALFLNNYVDIGSKWNDVPPVWRALIAGFPIIAQDIGSRSINHLAELVVKLHPYYSKELRREYHKKARPILLGILAELQAFLQDAAMAGGLPLVVTAGPPTSWKPWDFGLEKSYQIDDSLTKGNWVYLIPAKVHEMGIDIGRTWAGFLYDIVSRLPDPDKQRGKLLRKMDLLNEIYIWCSTAPSDFKPPLTEIVRRSVDSSEHTFAGVYKRLTKNSEESSE